MFTKYTTTDSLSQVNLYSKVKSYLSFKLFFILKLFLGRVENISFTRNQIKLNNKFWDVLYQPVRLTAKYNITLNSAVQYWYSVQKI